MNEHDLVNQLSNPNSMFDLFWDKFIYPIMENVFNDIDQEFKDACGLQFAYEDIDAYRKALRKTYREKREWLKEIYMPHSKSPVLDIHKLGAVICRSIIGNKPFSFNVLKAKNFVQNKFSGTEKVQNTDWFFSNIYANYKVAFYASIGAAYLNILYRCKVSNDVDSLNYFMCNPYLKFYTPNDSHEPFETSCMIALQKNDVLGRSFDYLGYAILIYQLEQYNYPTKSYNESTPLF